MVKKIKKTLSVLFIFMLSFALVTTMINNVNAQEDEDTDNEIEEVVISDEEPVEEEQDEDVLFDETSVEEETGVEEEVITEPENEENSYEDYGIAPLAAQPEDVAQVKETGEKYSTLQEAMDEAGDGDTVILLENITENVTISKSLTLDLHDHTIKGDGNNVITSHNYGYNINIVNGAVIDGGYSIWCSNGGIKTTITLENVEIASSRGIYLNIDDLNMTNCAVHDVTNSSGYGAIYYENTSRYENCIIIDGCQFYDNTNGYSYNGKGGAIYISQCNADCFCEIKNTEIHNNSATLGGGVYIESYGTVIIDNCDISDNQGTNFFTNDIAVYLSKYTPSSRLFIDEPSQLDHWTVAYYAANTKMHDDETYKSYPVGATADAPLDVVADLTDLINEKTYLILGFTAEDDDNVKDYVENTKLSTTYSSLAQAIKEAGEGDELKLLHKNKVNESMNIDKNLTINLNGYTIQVTDSINSLFNVSQNKELTLKNVDENSEPCKSVGLNNSTNDYCVYLNENAVVTIPSNLDIHNQAYESNSLYLCDGASIHLIDSLDNYTNKIYITLSKDVIEKYNKSQVSIEIPLVTVESDNTEGLEDIISLIKVNPNGIIYTDESGLKVSGKSIVLYKDIPAGVFLDGKNGSDRNEGYSLEKPVKTFEKAKELLNDSDYDTIYVTGAVTFNASNEEEWSLGENQKLMRYSSFTDHLVKIEGAGSLTLKDIIIDGNENTSDNSSLIYLSSNASLDIEEGTILQNNHASQSLRMAGAVYAVYKSNVVMNGGIIRNNTGNYGGAVYAYNQSSFIMNGGLITNNSATEGAVSVAISSTMTLSGGTISNNSATYGGAIILGSVNTGSVDGSKLTMTGGTIKDNLASINGGGIFVQCETEALITNGQIISNKANGSSSGTNSTYAGGGIYVNGKNTTTKYNDGILYLENAIITDNSAKNAGGGIAGCETSSVSVYPYDGSVIYNNSSNRSGTDIYCSRSNQEHFISDYMQDGSAYSWYDENTGSNAKPGSIQNTSNAIMLTNNALEEDVDKAVKAVESNDEGYVLISDNESGTSGGGIGTNGTVIVGNALDNLQISKTLIDNNDKTYNVGEEKFYFSIAVGLAANNSYVTVLTDANGDTTESTITFDENGYAQLTLKDGETILIKDLPYGAYFEVREEKDSSYDTVAEGTVDKDNSISIVDFTNTRLYGHLTLNKQTVGDVNTPDDARFKIIGYHISDSLVTSFTKVYEREVYYREFKDGEFNLENVPYGNYFVYEYDAQIDDYYLVTELGSDFSSVNDEKDHVMTITNTYKEIIPPEIEKYVADETLGEDVHDYKKKDEANNNDKMEYLITVKHISLIKDLTIHDFLDDQLVGTPHIISVILYENGNDKEGKELTYTLTSDSCSADSQACGLEGCSFEVHINDEDLLNLSDDAYIEIIFDIDLDESSGNFHSQNSDELIDKIYNDVNLSYHYTFKEYEDNVYEYGTPDEVETFSYGFNIFKYNDEDTPLKGVQFILYKETAKGTVYGQFSLLEDNSYLLTNWVDDDQEATELTSNEEGMITIEGLHEGDYMVRETEALERYQLLEEPITVTIVADEDYNPIIMADGEEVENHTVGVINVPKEDITVETDESDEPDVDLEDEETPGESAKTSDNTNIAIYIMGLGLSLLALLGITFARRKRYYD